MTLPEPPQQQPSTEISTAPPSTQPPVAPPGELPIVIPKRGPRAWLRDYFLVEEPSFGSALVPMCFLSMLLYTRSPRTNFIFDEQEALLANPYVRASSDAGSKIGWLEAFTRDFWGLPPDRTIGSYRPLPDLIWRALWKLGARDSPFLHHWINVLLHGVNGALLTLLVFKLTRKKGMAWLAGAIFVASAVVTEAVSGVVGIADVLGGLGAILALLSITVGRLWLMPLALLASMLVGLFSKESAMCCVPLVPAFALLCSQLLHPKRPLRWARAAIALVVCAGSFVFYVQLRHKLFPIHIPNELTAEANADKPKLQQMYIAVLRWFAQPGLPRDPLNNPLIEATTPFRIAGALRVYARGLGQVLFPWTLSGDYSAPQEPIPERLVFPESVIGAVMLAGPLLAAPIVGVFAWVKSLKHKIEDSESSIAPAPRDLRPAVAFGLLFVALSYFPVSNIPVLLPTVRAERFWYYPVIGSAIVLAIAFGKLWEIVHAKNREWVHAVTALFVLFFGFQCFAARRHALDYNDDLVFWNATRKAVPRSAKAHLNYSVMLGARGDLPGRLASNQIALDLAPKWPMASVYLGDTLCRMHRALEAIPHYIRGFDLGPNDMSLIALGVQCLWDEKMLGEDSDAWVELKAAAAEHPGSWLAYIVDDTYNNGEENKGVNPKYRPRGYNEGPKKEE